MASFLCCHLYFTYLSYKSSFSYISFKKIFLPVCERSDAKGRCEGSLFWLESTICHFISAASSLNCSQKLQISIKSYFLLWKNFPDPLPASTIKKTAIFGSACFNIAVSVLFPLLLSVPAEFNLKFRGDQMLNILMGPLKSMFLTGLTSQLMKINIRLLLYALIAIFACFWTNFASFLDRCEKKFMWLRTRENLEYSNSLNTPLLKPIKLSTHARGC